jgi:hypothetical protein
LSAENGVGASAAPLLLSVDIAQRLAEIHDFEALDGVSSQWFELAGGSVVEGLGGPGLVGEQLLCRVISGSEWASTVSHTVVEKRCHTRTCVSHRTWTRTNRMMRSSPNPCSKDPAAYSFHRSRRPASSPWQVFKVLKKRSSALSCQLRVLIRKVLIWVINWFKPWHYASLNFKLLNSWRRRSACALRHEWSIFALNLPIAFAADFSMPKQ